MSNAKPLTNIDRLRRLRAQEVLLMMEEHGLTVGAVAAATGRKPNTVYKAIESFFGDSVVLAYLADRLGEPFRNLWKNYPNHAT